MANRRSKNIPTYIESGQVHVQSFFSLGKYEKYWLIRNTFSTRVPADANK
jgi:hypothetical protein